MQKCYWNQNWHSTSGKKRKPAVKEFSLVHYLLHWVALTTNWLKGFTVPRVGGFNSCPFRPGRASYRRAVVYRYCCVMQVKDPRHGLDFSPTAKTPGIHRGWLMTNFRLYKHTYTISRQFVAGGLEWWIVFVVSCFSKWADRKDPHGVVSFMCCGPAWVWERVCRRLLFPAVVKQRAAVFVGSRRIEPAHEVRRLFSDVY